jgi:hypothetical protein
MTKRRPSLSNSPQVLCLMCLRVRFMSSTSMDYLSCLGVGSALSKHRLPHQTSRRVCRDALEATDRHSSPVWLGQLLSSPLFGLENSCASCRILHTFVDHPCPRQSIPVETTKRVIWLADGQFSRIHLERIFSSSLLPQSFDLLAWLHLNPSVLCSVLFYNTSVVNANQIRRFTSSITAS